jgi:hypothetical protein
MKTSTKQTIKVVLLLIALFAAAGVGLLSYVFHKQVQTPQVKALDAIPNHAALFFESTEIADFFAFKKEAQALFDIFLDKQQQENIQQMDRMVRDVKFGFDMEKYNAEFYLSIHFSRKNIALLFGIEVDKQHNKDLKDFAQRVETHWFNKSFTYKGNKILKLQLDKDILYFNSQNGLLLFSFDESLLRASIDQILLKDSLLHHVVHSFAHKRDANVSLRLYMQHAQCEPVFKKMLEETGGDASILRILSPFSWSALNVKHKDETFIFSGYAAVDTAADKAKLFTHLNKTLDIAKLLPSNAQNVFSLNTDTYKRFSQIKPYVQTSENVFALMYPRLAISFTINHNDMISNGLLLVSENPSEAAFHLFNSVESEFAENQYRLDTFYINTAMVGKINLNNFMITQLGYNQRFPKLRYYTLWGNNIVFTDTKEGMISYIQGMQEGKTLQTNSGYQAMSSYFSNQANVLYYSASPQKAVQQLRFQYDYFSQGLFLLDVGVRGKECFIL